MLIAQSVSHRPYPPTRPPGHQPTSPPAHLPTSPPAFCLPTNNGCSPSYRGEGRATASGKEPRLVRTAWTDEELVARSVNGDADSFNQLILRWERPIYALAYRTIGREEEARDIVQETFLRAFRALPGFKGQAKFSSWLYRIALNLCRDWIRKQRRTPTVATPEGVDLIELASEQGPVESIEELVSRREMSAAVAEAMKRLPEEQRTAIVLKEYHGLTFQEIAELQGCPLSTVKTRLYQGLSVLRRHLEASGMTRGTGRSGTSEKAS